MLLTTDNCLNNAEQSLEALDEWDASDGEQARRLLTHSCAELRESLMCDDDDELQLCELMSSSMCPEGCQRFKAGGAGLTCSALRLKNNGGWPTLPGSFASVCSDIQSGTNSGTNSRHRCSP